MTSAYVRFAASSSSRKSGPQHRKPSTTTNSTSSTSKCVLVLHPCCLAGGIIVSCVWSSQSERVKLSPRGVDQGWLVELEIASEEHRAWLTQAKSRALFTVSCSSVCVSVPLHWWRAYGGWCCISVDPSCRLCCAQVARSLRSAREVYNRERQEVADLEYELAQVCAVLLRTCSFRVTCPRPVPSSQLEILIEQEKFALLQV